MTTATGPFGQGYSTTTQPVAQQGLVNAKGTYDMAARIALQLENARTAPSLYGNATDEKVWGIDNGDLLFTLATSNAVQDDTGGVPVLSNLNGLGAQASILYPNDPEMVRQAVKNQIRYVGAAFQSLSGTREDAARGISVQIAGLKQLAIGNGAYGEDAEADTRLRPGDVVVAEVPEPTARGLSSASGDRVRQGVPATKFVLQLRRASHRSPGQALLYHTARIIEDPVRWRRAMGEHIRGTNAWMAAVRNMIRSYHVAIVLAVKVLADAKIIRAGTDAALFNGADSNSKLAVAVSRILGAVSFNEVDLYASPDGSAARKDDKKLVAQTVFRIDRAIFHESRDAWSEFGMTLNPETNQLTSTARIKNNPAGGIADTPEGKILKEQLTHFPRFASAIAHAIQTERANTVGRVTVGSSEESGGKAYVFLTPGASS